MPARRGGRDSGKGARPNPRTADSMRKVTVENTAAVDTCGRCGAGLSGAGADGRERRVLYDIAFEAAGRRVDAGIKECSECRARTKGRLPDSMLQAAQNSFPTPVKPTFLKGSAF